MKGFKLVLICVVFGSFSYSEKISSDLLLRLKSGEKVNVFVSFSNGIDSTIDSFLALRSSRPEQDRPSQLKHLKRVLIQNMVYSQKNATKTLVKSSKKGLIYNFKNFWITNQILIENADFSVVREIASDSNVKNIREEGSLSIVAPKTNSTNISLSEKKFSWGVRKIQAPEAWAQFPAQSTDEEVIVATIDTGVRHTHESLAGNFLGEFGWFDPSDSQETPFDALGHGTHVTGILAGHGGIGVAPNSKWAACTICSKDLKCLPHYTLECGQFFVCPTSPNGKSDCSKSPRVISNSWGTPMEEEWISMIKVWHAAGIIPVFALGNSGPSCGSTHFPGNHSDVIAVGNTNQDDMLHLTSSVGPTNDGSIKPDLVAPGTEILSASFVNDTAYRTATGTSMSAPYVAGVIALMISKQKELTFEAIKNILFESAEKKSLKYAKQACHHGDLANFPNVLFGHGRVSALKAMKVSQQHTCSKIF